MIAPEQKTQAPPETLVRTHAGPATAAVRVAAVAGLTMKESARKKVAVGMIVCSILMTLAMGLVARTMQLSTGSDTALAFVLQGLMRVVASFTWVLALFIAVTAIPPEMERRTTYTLFSKPLDRFEWVLGKFLGCCALLGANLLVVAAIVGALLWSENRDLTVALWLNLGTFFVSYTALIALAIACTLFLPMAVGALVALGLYFLGSAYGWGLTVAQHERLLPLWRGLGAVVYYIGRYATPRVNLLNVERPFAEIQGPSQATVIAWVLGYALLVLILGAALFSRREL